MFSALTNWFKVMFAASRINIFDLNPISSYPEFENGLTVSRRNSTGRDPIVWFPRTRQLISFVVITIVRIFRLKRFPKPETSSIIFVAGTKNQTEALKPIYEQLEVTQFWLSEPSIAPLRRFAYVISLLYFPCLIYQMICAKGYRSKSFRHSLEKYWLTYGIYFVIRIWLRKTQARSVVLANDHVGFYRTFNQAAQDEQVKTFYVQHACVADFFPPLIYDMALLDGLDAVDKYCNKPCKSKIFLTGIAKFNDANRVENDERNVIGVSFNLLDNEEFVKNLLRSLVSSFPKKQIISRLHPATPQNQVERISEFCNSQNILSSNPKSEDVFEYIKQIDVMVCGASSIILEAALKGVPSIAYFSEFASDVYGFVKNGLCEQAHSIDELVQKLESIQDDKQLLTATRYYCAGYGIENRPPAAKLAADIIQHSNDGPFEPHWVKLSTQNACVMEYVDDRKPTSIE